MLALAHVRQVGNALVLQAAPWQLVSRRSLISQHGWRERLPAGTGIIEAAQVKPEQKLSERRAQPSLRSVVQLHQRIEDADASAHHGLAVIGEPIGESEARRRII